MRMTFVLMEKGKKMPRYIDADEAYKVLTDYYHIRMEIQHKALKEAMERVPTVDAEPVVRCKDCKFYWKNNRDSDGVVCLATPKDEAFCSEGERRKDG